MQSDYQFEPVHIDWSGLRTQIIIGLLAIFSLCLVNFIPFRQGQSWDLAHGNWCDFTLYFASCSLVAFITLAICEHHGHRNGAGCAIWAALIFAVFPKQTIAYSSADTLNQMISFFILLSVFMLLSVKQKKSKMFAWLVLILISGAGIFLGGNYDFSPAALKQLFLPLHAQGFGQYNFYIVLTGYVLIILTFLSRILLHTLSWQGVGKIFFVLVGAVFFACISISSKIAATGLMATALSLSCLPGVDAVPANTNRFYSSLGITALTFLAVTLQYLLCIQIL